MAQETVKKHERSLGLWMNFLKSRGDEDNPCLRCTERCVVLQIIAMFVMRLSVDEGMSADAVSRAITGVKQHWKENLESTDVFDDPVIRTLRESCRAREGSGREKNIAKEKSRRMPVTLDMVAWVRGQYMEKSLNGFMTYLAVVMAFHFMFRASEYIFTKDGRHAIMCEDVDFILTGHRRASPWELTPAIATAEVERVLLVIRSSKCDKTGRGRYLYISRRTPHESQLLDDLIHWCRESGVTKGDPLFCRYQVGAKGRLGRLILTNKMVSEALKTMAAVFGFDVCFFTTHSLRIGGATTMLALGVSTRDVEKTGGWANPVTLQRVYDQNTCHDLGTLSVIDASIGSELLTYENVQHLMAPG